MNVLCLLVTAPWRLFQGPLHGCEHRERHGNKRDRANAARACSQATPRRAVCQDELRVDHYPRPRSTTSR